MIIMFGLCITSIPTHNKLRLQAQVIIIYSTVLIFKGSTTGQTYNGGYSSNLQFTANYHFRWKTLQSSPYYSLQSYTTSWTDLGTSGITVSHNGNFVEFSIPFTSLGVTAGSQIRIVANIINEATRTSTCFAPGAGQSTSTNNPFIYRNWFGYLVVLIQANN